MNFSIHADPPGKNGLDERRKEVLDRLRRIKRQDTIISFILLLAVSLALAFVVYWSTGNLRHALIAAWILPMLGAVLGLSGLLAEAGFRSNNMRLIELKNDLFSLSPVSETAGKDIRNLCGRYPLLRQYHDKVLAQGREMTNGELAMFWEWDASTDAKTARGREFLAKSRHAITG